LAIAEADRAALSDLAGKFATLKTESHTLVEGAGTYLAKLVFFGHAAVFSVGAKAFGHSGTDFTSNAANSNFHLLSP